MADDRLRELERRLEETRDPGDEAALLAELLRAGLLTREQLALAADLGHAAALLLERERSGLPLDQLLARVRGLGPEASRYAAAALAAAMSRWVEDARSAPTLEALTAALRAGASRSKETVARCAAALAGYGVWSEVSTAPGLTHQERLSIAMAKALQGIVPAPPNPFSEPAEEEPWPALGHALCNAADQHSGSEGVGPRTDTYDVDLAWAMEADPNPTVLAVARELEPGTAAVLRNALGDAALGRPFDPRAYALPTPLPAAPAAPAPLDGPLLGAVEQLAGLGGSWPTLLEPLRRRSEDEAALDRLGEALRFLLRLAEDDPAGAPAPAADLRLVLDQCRAHLTPDPAPWREVLTRDGVRPLFRTVEAGAWTLGRAKPGPWEQRPHRVELGAFRIAIVPVTNAQLATLRPGHGWSPTSGVSRVDWARLPACVGREEASTLCELLAERVPGCSGARLPSEAEWECAARAGTRTDHWSGDDVEALARVAWFDATSGGRLHPVAELPANPWGLYDVLGNVWEWVEERHGWRPWGQRSFPVEKDEDDHGEHATLRGGDWRSAPSWLRATYRVRSHGGVGAGLSTAGVRIVLPA